MAEELLTAEQVAKMLSVDTSWVHRHAREGKIPCVQLGRYHRFRRQSILDWIAAQEKPASKRPTAKQRPGSDTQEMMLR